MKSLETRLEDRAQREKDAQELRKQNGQVASPGAGPGDTEAADYSDFTVAELKEELEAKQIQYAASAKKDELIKLLND